MNEDLTHNLKIIPDINQMFKQLKDYFVKTESQSHPVPPNHKIMEIIKEMNNEGIMEIPILNSIEEFIELEKDSNSSVCKIEKFFAEQKRIKHQTGRGETAVLLMIPNAKKSNLRTKKETGDIVLNSKMYEFKKEGQILDFAVKTSGAMTKIYNEIIELRSFINLMLKNHFNNTDSYKYLVDNFSFKITEFRGGEIKKKNKINDFELFDNLLYKIKNDTTIVSSDKGKLLLDTIKDFNTSDWKKHLCAAIINSYSGGVVVYRNRKKGNKNCPKVIAEYIQNR